MTENELYELVKDLPRELQPLSFDWTQYAPGYFQWQTGDGDRIEEEEVEAFYVGKLVEVLAEVEAFFTIDSRGPEGSWEIVKERKWSGNGPTLLHALIAAYKGASEHDRERTV